MRKPSNNLFHLTLCGMLATLGLVARSQLVFTDVTAAAGLRHLHEIAGGNPVMEQPMMAGGAAAGDFDGDGWVDLYVTRVGVAGSLYRNNGNGTFADVSASYGLNESLPANGAAWGDIDNDGDLDLCITAINEQRLYLYVNQETGPFTEEAIERGAAISDGRKHGGYGVTVGDFDRDGWLDIHTTEWGQSMTESGKSHSALLRNRGVQEPGHFTDVTLDHGVGLKGKIVPLSISARVEANDITALNNGVLPDVVRGAFTQTGRILTNGAEVNVVAAGSEWRLEDEGFLFVLQLDNQFIRVTGRMVYSFASRFSDLDNDGWPDLTVAADFGTSQLFWNNRNGTFSEAAVGAGIGTDENGMGSAIGDYDGDGFLDWFVTSILDPVTDRCSLPNTSCNWGGTGNRLYRNLGNRTFADATDAAGVRNGYWGWGSTFLDYDNDGDLDLVMTNGIDMPENEIFSLSPFSADDFGQLDAGGAIPDALRTEFTTRSRGLAVNATVVVISQGSEWRIDDAVTFYLLKRDGDALDVFHKIDTLYEKDPMRLWRNDGGTFTEVSATAGITNTGNGKGLLTFDYDRDGDLDIFVVNNANYPVLYQNDGGNSNHWLRVTLAGRQSSRLGVGAVVRVQAVAAGPVQVREISGGNNFLGQDEATAHFGLGAQTAPVAVVTIQWPSGLVQRLENVPVDTLRAAVEPDTSTIYLELGWNLIAVPTAMDYPQSGILRGSIWRWNAFAQQFTVVPPTERLIPGVGYWMWATTAGRLN